MSTFNHLKLASIIAENGVLQRDLAGALGVHYNTISAWVTGARTPLPSDLYSILMVLGWSDERIARVLMVDFYPISSIGSKRKGRKKKDEIEHGSSDVGRTEDMKRLRHEQRWSLKAIGEKYNISRERVRQIIGNTGVKYINEPEKALIAESSHLTTKELAEIVDMPVSSVRILRQNTRYKHTEDTTLGFGLEWEERAAEVLRKNGYEVELQSYGKPFDILVNGKCRIDVKSTSAPRESDSIVKNCINPQWSFSLRECHHDVDFYVLIIAPTNDYFIVPSSEPPQYKGSVPHIRFSWPTSRPTIGRYQKYHNRFDLIRVWLDSQE